MPAKSKTKKKATAKAKPKTAPAALAVPLIDRFSLMLDGREIGRFMTKTNAIKSAEDIIRNPNQRAIIQDLQPVGQPGDRVAISWKRDRLGGWRDADFHNIPG